MPSSSRKKNKGRERKAKKEESKKLELYNYWQDWARGEYSTGVAIVQCNHGVQLPDISHPVSSFLNTFFNTSADNNSLDPIEKHIDVWTNESYRMMASSILITIGANWILDTTDEWKVGNLATTILLLENFGKTNEFYSTIYRRGVGAKKRDLSIESGSIELGRRDMLKFFRKRMNCKCLKKMHLESRKTLPKLGICNNCGVVKGRASLMICSRCRVDQFCSRECQVAASHKHRDLCDSFVRAHEHSVTNTIT